MAAPRRGTASYMAPEVSCEHLELVSDKADVWSFGIILWEMTVRELLFYMALPGRGPGLLRMRELSCFAAGAAPPR